MSPIGVRDKSLPTKEKKQRLLSATIIINPLVTLAKCQIESKHANWLKEKMQKVEMIYNKSETEKEHY